MVALFSFYPVWLNLNYAQINILLALLAMNFLGSYMAVLVKPYYLVFPLIWLYRNRKAFYWFGMGFMLVVLGVVVWVGFPTREALEYAGGSFFNHKTNLIHLLPIYYLLMKNE